MNFSIKLNLFIVLVVFILGATISAFVYFSNLQILEGQIEARLEGQAQQAMESLDRTLFERGGDIRIIASDPIIVSENSTPSQISRRLIDFRNIYLTYVSLSFFDMNRTRIADTSGLDIGMQDPPSLWWNESAIQGKVSIASDVHFSQSLGAYVIYFSAPVRSENGSMRGVVVARMPLSRLSSAISEINTNPTTGIGNAGASGNESIDVDLIRGDGALLYSSKEKDDIFEIETYHKDFMNLLLIGGASESKAILPDPNINNATSIFVAVKESGYLTFPGNGWVLLLRAPTQQAFAPADDLRNSLILILLSSMVLTSIISTRLSYLFSDPILKLTRSASELQKGNFSTRVDIKTGDELEQLAVSMNDAAEALGKVDEERKQIDRAKTQFLTITSHELRSPMTPMKAQLQMLEASYFGELNPQQKESVRIIIRNADRLDRILMDFLEISRIEAARLQFSFQKTDVKALINEVADYMKGGIMPEKSVKIVRMVAPLPQIEVDPDRFAQVLRNLLNNAIKYSEPGGTVEIGAKLEGAYIHLWVKDHGIGISEEDQKSLFEPFFQADKTFSRQQGGTGLGLAICRGIIESQGGKIGVESTLGKGSTFHFTIPISPVLETRPIKILFSARENAENYLRLAFIEALGPVGSMEFDALKETKRLNQQDLRGYVEALVEKGILSRKQGDALSVEITRILGGKSP